MRSQDLYVPAVCALAQHTSLEEIRIFRSSRASGLEYIPAPAANVWEIINPLLSLPRLRRLSLYLGRNWTVGDDTLSAIARTWPALEELALFVGNSPVSLQTFALVLAGCPGLRMFDVALDLLSAVPNLEAYERGVARPNRSLVKLRFTAAHEAHPTWDCGPIVRFLHAACPMVQCRVNRGPGGRREPGLPQVAEIRQLMKSLRQQALTGKLTLAP